MKPISPRLELQLLLSERGFMLVTSLLVTAIIVTLGVAVSFTVMNNSLIARNVSEITQSRYQADGGIDVALAYLRSGEATIQFTPNPPVAAAPGAVYQLDTEALADDINIVLASIGVQSVQPQFFGADSITCSGDPTDSSTVYVSLGSRFQDDTNLTKTTRNASIGIDISCKSSATPSRPCVGGKGLNFNGKTALDIACEVGGNFTANGPLLKSNGELAEIYVDPTLKTCNSNQNFANGNGDSLPAYCKNNQAAREEMKLPTEVKVTIPTHSELTNNVLRRQLKNELAASGLSLDAYLAQKTVNINAGDLNFNNSSNFNSTLQIAVNAKGGGNQGCTNNTIVRINGNAPIPGGVNLTNCILIVDGALNFNSGNFIHTNSVIVANGNLNFNGNHTFYNNTSILASGSVNMNSIPSFKATDRDNVYTPVISIGSGSLNFNGGFKQAGLAKGESINLAPAVVSQGSITFNGSSVSAATLVSKGNITFNGKSGVEGAVKTQGTLRFNGGPLVGVQSKEEWIIALKQQAEEMLYGPDAQDVVITFAPEQKIPVEGATVVTRQ